MRNPSARLTDTLAAESQQKRLAPRDITRIVAAISMLARKSKSIWKSPTPPPHPAATAHTHST